MHVRAATEFTRRTDVHHTDGFAVLFPEKHHRARGFGFLNRKFSAKRFRVREDFFIDNLFDLSHLTGRHGFVVREVKARNRCIHKTSLLRHVHA